MQTDGELRQLEAQLTALVREHKAAIGHHRRALVKAAADLERVKFQLRQSTSTAGAGVIHGRTDSQS